MWYVCVYLQYGRMQGAEAFQANMSTRRRVSLTPPALAEYISNSVQKETGRHHLQGRHAGRERFF